MYSVTRNDLKTGNSNGVQGVTLKEATVRYIFIFTTFANSSVVTQLNKYTHLCSKLLFLIFQIGRYRYEYFRIKT